MFITGGSGGPEQDECMSSGSGGKPGHPPQNPTIKRFIDEYFGTVVVDEYNEPTTDLTSGPVVSSPKKFTIMGFQKNQKRNRRLIKHNPFSDQMDTRVNVVNLSTPVSMIDLTLKTSPTVPVSVSLMRTSRKHSSNMSITGKRKRNMNHVGNVFRPQDFDTGIKHLVGCKGSRYQVKKITMRSKTRTSQIKVSSYLHNLKHCNKVHNLCVPSPNLIVWIRTYCYNVLFLLLFYV